MVIDKKTLNVPRPRRSFQIKGPQAGAAAAARAEASPEGADPSR